MQTEKQTNNFIYADRKTDRQTNRHKQSVTVRAEEEVKANKMLNPWGEKISLLL